MKKSMWKWFVSFLLIAVLIVFGFSAWQVHWLATSETVTGFVTDTRTEYPCVQGNGCAEIYIVEIDGEEFHYVDAANDNFPFADIHVGDHVVATTQGDEVRLPFNVRLFHPEIVDLKQANR